MLPDRTFFNLKKVNSSIIGQGESFSMFPSCSRTTLCFPTNRSTFVAYLAQLQYCLTHENSCPQVSVLHFSGFFFFFFVIENENICFHCFAITVLTVEGGSPSSFVAQCKWLQHKGRNRVWCRRLHQSSGCQLFLQLSSYLEGAVKNFHCINQDVFSVMLPSGKMVHYFR